METVLGTLLAFIIVFGILVFVHEFGHFIMAKLVGIRVEVFSFGYGKRLFGFKKGNTDYRVSLIPMGGYVKMLGEGMFETEREIAPDDMMAKNRIQRFLVMVMGSVMNILLAVFLVAVLNLVGVSVPEHLDQTPVIGWIDTSSPAEKADLRVGDEILRINDQTVKTWSEVEIAVGSKPDKLLRLDINRDGRILPIDLQTEADTSTRFQWGYAGFKGMILTQIQMVAPNSPAAKGGLEPGDIIVAIDGEPIYYYHLIQVLQKNAGKELQITVERKGESLILPVTPRQEGKVGKIGIAQIPKSVVKKFSFFPAIGESVRQNLSNAFLIINFIKDLFTGEASTRQVGGPLEIANVSYAFLRMGVIAMMSWIAIISLQLGIINLFPIPVFDGGHIFVLLIEGIFRRDLNPKARQIWMQFGFVIFIVLIVFIILNDIVKRLPNGWGSLIPF
jgi:regulator of sigma E protease